MPGTKITNATYVRGDTSLGQTRIPVTLIAFPTSLTIRKRRSDEGLLSIPWSNITKTQIGTMEKNAGRRLATNLFIVGTAFLGMLFADGEDWGVFVHYHDPPTQRDQTPFFALTGDSRRAEKIMDEIWHYRDQFYRDMNTSSKPLRR